MYKGTIAEFMDPFRAEMITRIYIKLDKYGNTWKERPVEPETIGSITYAHQNERFLEWFMDKFVKWKKEGEPINWVDVAVEAMICWIREKGLHKDDVVYPK